VSSSLSLSPPGSDILFCIRSAENTNHSIMIAFVWSSNGGPLQYIGLAIFAMQLIPHFMRNIGITDSNMEKTVLLVCHFVPAMAGMILPLIAGYWYLNNMLREDLEEEEEGTAAQDDGGHQEHQLQLQQERPARTHERRESWNSSILGNSFPYSLILPAIFCGIMGLASFIFSNGNQLFLVCFHFSLLAVFMTRVVKDFIASMNNDATESGDQRRRNRNEFFDIVETIRVLPIEEFLTEEEVRTSCSIPQLKRMLRRREREGEARTCTERRHLVEELEKCRNYNETCCICAEEYKDGDSLRILPKCCHEFHVECIDMWAYTFASNKSRKGQAPSCPLCKTLLK